MVKRIAFLSAAREELGRPLTNELVQDADATLEVMASDSHLKEVIDPVTGRPIENSNETLRIPCDGSCAFAVHSNA